MLTITGRLPPQALRAHAGMHGVSLAYRTPVPIRLSNARSPGIWYVEGEISYVPRLLVHPERLGVVGDRIETRRVRIPGIRNGRVARRVLLETLNTPGVINVLPNLPAGTIDVVGRNDPATWAALRGTLDRVAGRSLPR